MLNESRVKKLCASMGDVDAMFMEATPDLEYMTGLKLHSDERLKGIILCRDGRAFAIAPAIYSEEMAKNLGASVPCLIWADHEGFGDVWKKGCTDYGLVGGKIAVNEGVRGIDLIKMGNAANATYVDGCHLTGTMRKHKDASEMEIMRKASAIADEVALRLTTFIKPGMTEKVVAKQIIAWFEELGAEGLSFNPIVASGPGGSMPHYGGNSRIIEPQDVVLIDMGCRYKGYCSDITRTLFVGEPTPKQREVYEVVRAAQAAGEAAIRPGVTSQEVDRAARKVIIDAGYGNYFNNRVGHGTGLAIHEEPYIIEGSTYKLEPGNVFSIEPGIYIPGEFGVRIENLVAVNESGGPEALNKFTRELTVIKA